MHDDHLNSKKLLWIGLALAWALIVVLYASFLNYRAALVERLTIAADLRLNAVQTELAEAEADAQIFARAFGELHSDDGISAEMQAFAKLFLQQYQHYFQARILDTSGQEIRKWSWDGAKVKASDALQDKSDRYYFWEGQNLAPGQSYLSRVDYNQEQGALELPLRPTVRSVARYDYNDHDHDHDHGYIAVLNMDLSRCWIRSELTILLFGLSILNILCRCSSRFQPWVLHQNLS